MTNEAVFTKDLQNKKLNVVRAFDAPLDLVWRAWTESEMLDQWWAPKPYRAETKEMDFREGGRWIYQMVGPEHTEHSSWCKEEFKTIVVPQKITNAVSFCDEKGVTDTEFPVMNWEKNFTGEGERTTVNIDIYFDRLTDLEKIVGMGFQEGFTAGLSNLDDYLAAGFRLRKEMKTSNAPRVTTYLNFPGNTEEAFLFYKEVFRGEFTGKKLTRFSDIELPAEVQMKEEDKKLIIHAELTIMGGHVLMATDAPESMGFKLHTGNNMHINVEPESREETERLFNELSAGGVVSMPLSDMFFGAYFAELTDKFGINWMLTYQNV